MRKKALLALLALVATLIVLCDSITPPAFDLVHASGGGPEMVLNVKGGDCDDPVRPTKCDVALGSPFHLAVHALGIPANGYTGMETFIDYGSDLVYKPASSGELFWPDGLDDSGFPIIDELGPGLLHHATVTGLISPPQSTYVGKLVAVSMNCPDASTVTTVDLLPRGDPVAGFNGSAFQEFDTAAVIIPKVGSLTINCTATASPPGPKPAPSFRLPWNNGVSWKYSGGPHGSSGSGIDFANPSGNIRAAADGWVTFIDTVAVLPQYCPVSSETTWNTAIRIDHGGGWATEYWHWSDHAWSADYPEDRYPGVLSGAERKWVNQGDIIGDVGSVGCSGGSHIHLELLHNGVPESWDGRSIGGWTPHVNCVPGWTGQGYSGTGTCQDGNYNGYLEEDSTGNQTIPLENPGDAQLVPSDNAGPPKPTPPSPLESAGGTIGVSGGTVSTGTGDSVEGSLSVPAGAVDGDTGIIIDVFNLFDIAIPAGAGEFFSRVFSFGPNGFQFNSPAELTVSYSEAEATGMDENNLGAFIYNVLTGETELAEITSRDILSNFLTFELPHFSVVAVRDLSTSDFDGDSCVDSAELVTASGSETLGGLRDPLNPWDFYDVDGDGDIDLFGDILGVILHYSLDGSSPYDVNFDRGPTTGPNPWNMTAPDGGINLFNDILGVIQQYGHDCT